MSNKMTHWFHHPVQVPRILVIVFWIISLLNFGALLNRFIG